MGILQAVGRLTAGTHPEMLHLRSLNPYVGSTFAANAKGNSAWAARRSAAASTTVSWSDSGSGATSSRFGVHCGFTAARQPQPMVAHLSAADYVRPASTSGAIGISAFAFQGTNAHVLLAAAEPDAALFEGGPASAPQVGTLQGAASGTPVECTHSAHLAAVQLSRAFNQCKSRFSFCTQLQPTNLI